MHLQDILRNNYFQQIAPLAVLFVIPASVFFASRFLRSLRLDRLVLGWYRSLSMGLESLGVSWLWSGSSPSSASGSHGKRGKRKTIGGSSKSKTVRTRAEQIALNNLKKQKLESDEESDDGYYAGLVNISGTYCFMNSTLQAMASLSYLQPHIETIQHKAEVFDVPTPVIDALQELFKNLNTPKSSYHSLRPQGIIAALSSPSPQSFGNDSSTYRTSTSLFNSREHQDAQELFQLVTECLKNEMAAVDRESLRDRGIAGVLDLTKTAPTKEKDEISELKTSKNVFDGLTANRRSCVICGYTEAVMHFGFDNWQLAVPRLATSCRLEDCLEEYTRLEILKDCVCRNCTMLATHKRLLQELKALEDALSSNTPSSSAMPSSSPTKSKPSTSKKKRVKEVKRMEQRVRTVMADGRIEEDSLLEGIRLEKVVSPASTKQAMIARPPPVLALHLNRSVHYGHYAAKNTIKVIFPEVLDLTPYTTSGSLSTVPTSSISTPSPPATPRYYQPTIPQIRSSSGSSAASSSGDSTSNSNPPKRVRTPTPETYAPGSQRTIYRLSAVVCHFGQHSFGHYICYRRKPRRIGGKWMPPTLIDPLRLEMEDEDARAQGPAQDSTKANGSATGASDGRRMADYSGSSTLGETRYYWEDRTEEEVDTGRGWLRISDESVSECGIESVLAEGSGAFMLYYEKAVHPRPGVYLSHARANGKVADPRQALDGADAVGGSRSWTPAGEKPDYYGDGMDPDGDSFSIGSEETLKPETKVVNLNGSVGSLVSEVGVGVMKSPKKEKESRKEKAKLEKKDSFLSMSVHLSDTGSSSSKVFGPRIVRSVNARRRNTPQASGASTNGIHPSASSDLGSTSDAGSPLANGSAVYDGNHGEHYDDKLLTEMTALAPSILPSASVPKSNSTSKKAPPTPSTSTTTPKKNAHLGPGSKSTKVMHASPQSVKVKAR